MWIARDKNGSLYIYEEAPHKTATFNACWVKRRGYMNKIPSNLFPEVKWEDKEPRELILK